MKINQEEFDRLPALLPRGTAMRLSGLSKHELTAEAKAKRIRTHPPYGTVAKRHHKYFKVDLAGICGMKN